MLVRKYQWMGVISFILTLFLLTDSLTVLATETGTIEGAGNSEKVEQYIVDEDEIWAQIDRDELRSLIDVEALKETIDLDALRTEVDKTLLLEQISDLNLLDSMSAEEILKEYNSLKESDKLDELIKEVVESEEFDEDFIKNHPVDVPNVKVPIISGSSPLDYIVDPMELIYQTEAVKYGGGNVQEGAPLLFRNSEGEYLFSDTSDMLSIVNRGNVPLQVTISAKLEDTYDVSMVDSRSDLGGTVPQLFMALVGKEGIISVLNDSGTSEITVVLEAVPEGTYKYTFNDETGKYESEMSENADESTFDSFSFGVTGDCNKDADWTRVNALPKMTVTWKTEPVLTDWDKVNEELEEADKVKFEAFKKVKLAALRDEELERLVQIQLDELVSEELDKLIDEEVERLAKEKFEELKQKAITEAFGEVSDDEDPVIEDTSGSDEILLIDEPVVKEKAADDTVSADEAGSGETETEPEEEKTEENSEGEVLGAKRETVEFFNSESVEQNTSGAAEENISDAGAGSTDEPVLFINEEDSAGETIIF